MTINHKTSDGFVVLTPANGKDIRKEKDWVSNMGDIYRAPKREDARFNSRYGMKPRKNFGRPVKKASRKGKKPGRDYPKNKTGHNKNPHKK